MVHHLIPRARPHVTVLAFVTVTVTCEIVCD